MKGLKLFIGLILFSLALHAQKPQAISTWYEYQKFNVAKSFVPPTDTLSAADSGAIATKGNHFYVKNATWHQIDGNVPGNTLYSGDGRFTSPRHVSGGNSGFLEFDSLTVFDIIGNPGHSVQINFNTAASTQPRSTFQMSDHQVTAAVLNGTYSQTILDEFGFQIFDTSVIDGSASSNYVFTLMDPSTGAGTWRKPTSLGSGNNLDSVLFAGDTAYQKDIIISWDARDAAYSAGFARRFYVVHPDSLNGFWGAGDIDGNSTALEVFMSQKVINIRSDSGFQLAGVGNSAHTLIQTQAAQSGWGGITQRIKLPFTQNLSDTFFVKDDLRKAILKASAVLDFPSTGASAVSDLTVTVTGAAVGDPVQLGVDNASLTTTGSFSAWVSSTNTVTVRYSPKATENPASGTFKISILKYQ